MFVYILILVTKYWNILVFFFFTKPHRKNSCDPECAGGSYETHWDYGGMFQLDFCLWVSRFELFMIELHTILVQGIYEKKRFFSFFLGMGGNPECAGGSCETHWDSVGMFRLGGRQPKKPPGN